VGRKWCCGKRGVSKRNIKDGLRIKVLGRKIIMDGIIGSGMFNRLIRPIPISKRAV
jgi:hypothetical protein